MVRYNILNEVSTYGKRKSVPVRIIVIGLILSPLIPLGPMWIALFGKYISKLPNKIYV